MPGPVPGTVAIQPASRINDALGQDPSGKPADEVGPEAIVRVGCMRHI